jgi:endonuclease YncB( thermonuclease family)
VPVAVVGIGLLDLAFPVHATSVLCVSNGDTIRFTNSAQKTRVRLACFDTHETFQTPCGMESRLALQRLLPIGEEASIRTKAADRYGRAVGEVFRGTTNSNQQQVASGNAFGYWHYISGDQLSSRWAPYR